MPILYGENRQEPCTAVVQFNFNDATSGAFTPLLTLPNSSIITGGALLVTTASDAATSETLSIGTSGAATSIANAVNAKSAARTALTLTNTIYSGRTVIGVTRTAVGATTTGSYTLVLEYVTVGSSDFTQN